jgi:hypothetical protein
MDNVKADVTLGSVSLQVGQTAVHTLNSAVLAWQQVLNLLKNCEFSLQ